MPTVASYIEEAKAALLTGDAARAAEVCQHVLQHRPKHVEANCLLAEALRDLGDTERAKDLYLRVVSADPTNLIAHWALGLIAEAQHDREWAVWELTRAWESGQEHLELRRELQRLAGSPPALTPFALARLYVSAGLFDEAIDELERLLAAEPTRLDVAVVLAESLWRSGEAARAARVCESILDDSPDCLRANLILGSYLYGARQPLERERGRALLERARELEPAGATAAELLAGQPLPDVLAAEYPEIPALEVAPESPSDGAGTEAVNSGELAALENRPAADGSPGVAPVEPAGAPGRDGQSNRESDFAAWLQDTGQRSPTVQKALEARLAPRPVEPPTQEHRSLEDLDPEWQALLSEEITFDRESEERLNRALAEAGLAGGQQADDGWLEVPTVASSERPRLWEVTRAVGESRAAEAPGTPRAHSPGADRTPVPAAESPQPAPTSRTDPAAELERAAALWRGGNPADALEVYRWALGAAPSLCDDVVAGLKGLVEAHPDFGAAHRVLGDAYMRAGRFQQAIDEYNRVLADRQASQEASGTPG